jgi:DNA-binding MarR family transcriptional regulator
MKIEDEIKQSKFESEFHKLTINVLFSGKWISDVMNQFHKKYDISSQQYNVLRILRGQYPKAATVNLISERMIDRQSNVSRLIDKLETKGLVERNSCENDRRQVDIKITSVGLDLLERIAKAQPEMMDKLKHLSEDEAVQLNNLLDKLRG